MKRKYFITLDDAMRAIKRENAIQAAKKEFYNITLRKTKNGNFAVIIGG
jgi:hypothetical protein